MSSSKESNLESLRFPTNQSISQVKRNAKRLSDELNIPLNKALDLLARESLGIPESTFHWAQAVSILKRSNELFLECSVNVDVSALSEIESSKSLKDLLIVAFDGKDAMEFRDNGPWRQSIELSSLMSSALVAWLAQSMSEEDGREAPTNLDIEYAVEASLDYYCYYLSGANQMKTFEDVITDLSKRVFFPPEAVWINGKLKNNQLCSIRQDGEVVGLRF